MTDPFVEQRNKYVQDRLKEREGEEIKSLRSQLSDCTLAREQLEGQLAAAELELKHRRTDREMRISHAKQLKEQLAAAEAALAEAVKERDELAAQLAIVLNAICDTTELVDPEIANEMRRKLPARAQTLLNVVRAAEAETRAEEIRYTDDPRNRTYVMEERAKHILESCREKRRAAVRALKDSQC